MVEHNLNRWLALGLIILCFAATLVGLNQRQSNKNVRMTDLGTLTAVDRLLLVKLEGAISGSGSSPLGGSSQALEVRDQLLAAAKDDQIKGVLLRIDSPGGTVGASQEVYNAVLAVRESKPVVVSMGDVAASGGYYIACAADQIYANPGTLTGSIGVIISGFNVAGLFNRLGVEPQVIKSGKFKDILSTSRALTADERTLLQALINNTYEQFLQAVAKGRKKDIQVLRPLADGRIFTGQQAQQVGLVDTLGGLVEAEQALQKLAHARFALGDEDLPVSGAGNSWGDLLKRVLPSTKLEIKTALDPSLAAGSLQPLWLAPGLGP